MLVVVTVALAVNLPETGAVPENVVPFAKVRDLALRKAEAEWPGCRLGSVVPCVDEDGATAAYMFHFRTDGKPFPDYEEVVRDILVERDGLNAFTDLRRWTSKYSHILVSARYDRPPIVRYGYGTSEFYAVAGRALERAQEILGADARLSRMYFLWPATWLEFEGRAGHVVFSPHFEQSWFSREDFFSYVTTEARPAPVEATQRFQREWEEALRRDFRDFSEVLVPNADKAPFYDWSYGCTPTAAAMTLGFIDRVHDYGRLVDWYWHRYDMVEREWDKQIPNVQRECALAMFTDTTRGGTYLFAIAPGLDQVGADNGYTFETVSQMGSSGNDWAWSTITDEIDNGYNFVWSAIWEIHSLAAYGYRTPDKDLYVHNTWWAPAEWWHYSGNGESHVGSPHPSGGDAHKLELVYPKGDTNYNSIGRGQVLQVGSTCNVTWSNFSRPAHWVAIDISRDAGLTWTVLDSVPDTGAYAWTIADTFVRCDSVRLRFRQYYSGDLTSADGSFGCFRLVREPLPPRQLSPANGSQVFDPPVVLRVDSTVTGVDTFEFRLIKGTDTLLRVSTTVPNCPLADTLFEYNRSYKWQCRGRNRFGWGDLTPAWSFYCKFHPGVEEGAGRGRPMLFDSPMLASLKADGVRFGFRSPGSGARLELFDATGTRVRTLTVGGRQLWWNLTDDNGRRLGAGMYFIRFTDGQTRIVRKLVLVD